MAREPVRDPGLDALVADLRAFGPVGAATEAEVAAVTDAVLARLDPVRLREAPPAGLPGWLLPERLWGRVSGRVSAWVARYRRRLAVALVVVVLALTGVPAVRAAVADWFGFAGVRVRLTPEPSASASPSASVAPQPPMVAAGSLAEAARLVPFAPLVPAALGEPDGVEVSPDGRVLSLAWNDPRAGVVRLDEFDGRLDYRFAKTASEVEWTFVGDQDALWFERPHEVAWLDGGSPGGSPEESRQVPPRLAGHTLIWQHGETTLRLEGDLTLERAREIAASVRTR
jgi:hypothetical protein